MMFCEHGDFETGVCPECYPEPPVEAPGKAREVEPVAALPEPSALGEDQEAALWEAYRALMHMAYKLGCTTRKDCPGCLGARVANNLQAHFYAVLQGASLETPKASEASEVPKSSSPNPSGEVVGSPTSGEDHSANIYLNSKVYSVHPEVARVWAVMLKHIDEKVIKIERLEGEVSRLREVEKRAKALTAFGRPLEGSMRYHDAWSDLHEILAVGAGDDPEKGEG
jgi:hypothetical protein